MTTQIYNAELVELLRSVFAERNGANSFAYNIVAPWYDYPLNDTVDGNHFNDNDSSYPTGWTEVDAPNATNTNDQYGFWYISGNSADTSWKYRKQMTFNQQSSANQDWNTFIIGPVLYRDGDQPNDVTYKFGVYADNSGIDEDVYIRTELQWDSSAGNWRIRGQNKDGTTTTTGSWFSLSQYPPAQPLYMRVVLRFFTGLTFKVSRAYVGLAPVTKSHTLLLSDGFDPGINFGQAWWQFEMSRSATGIEDYLFVGAIDRNIAP